MLYNEQVMQQFVRILNALATPEAQQKLRELKRYATLLLFINLCKNPFKTGVVVGLQSKQTVSTVSDLEKLRYRRDMVNQEISNKICNDSLSSILPKDWMENIFESLKLFFPRYFGLVIQFSKDCPRVSVALALTLSYLYRYALRQFIFDIMNYFVKFQNNGK